MYDIYKFLKYNIMRCFVKKLEGTSTNPDLPVFNVTSLKDWLKTTADGQYVLISDTTKLNMTFANTFVDITFRIPSGFSQHGTKYVFCSRGQRIKLISNNDERIDVYAGDASNYNTFSCSFDTAHNIKINTSEKTIVLDGVSQSYSYSPDTSFVQAFDLFAKIDGQSSFAGEIWVGEIKIAKASSPSTYIYDLVPCIHNDVSCLYDKISHEYIYEVNNGSLLAFDE
jgi:hypothetical protein